MKTPKVKPEKLPPGPYATHFQEYAHDRYFNAPMERERFTQQPRVGLGDFLANRLARARRVLQEAEEVEKG